MLDIFLTFFYILFQVHASIRLRDFLINVKLFSVFILIDIHIIIMFFKKNNFVIDIYIAIC